LAGEAEVEVEVGEEGASEEQDAVTAHPFLKMVGGKTVLLPEILTRLPAKISTYYEPFVGGGAVFFALAAEGRFKRAVIGDANRELMHTYFSLSCSSTAIIRSLKRHTKEHSEAHFYEVRAIDKCSPVERAARMIYLNRTCFNGLYRVNKAGRFNVPFGRYTNPKICDEENLLAVAETLYRVPFEDYRVDYALDFEKTVLPAKRGDVVYMDPPYAPLSPTANFTTYTSGGFTLEDQTRLRDVAKNLVERGVHVLLSNSDTPLVRKLYRGFKIEEVQAPRRVNSKGGKRGNVGELLISGRNAHG
jgi:DNA adenine methylase